MADPRTFVLIGNFTDNITPSLQKINESLAKVKANLESVSKATKPLKTDFRQLASLSDNFAKGLKTQASDIRDVTKSMRAMRNEMGRVNRAYKAGGRNVVQDARRFTTPPPPPPPRTPRFATPPPPPPPPRTPRYRYTDPPMPPGGGGGRGGYGGGGGRGGYSGAVGGAVAGSVIGNQTADFLTGAIVKGFQMGVSIMEKPFQYFSNALGERIRDEMSDIKAAGGYFSISKRQADPFVKTFDQALDFTQKNNAVMAKLAAALPGSTQDYIEVSKRIGDSIARTVMTDKGAAIAYANKLRQEFPTMYGAQLQGTGKDATQGAITTLLGELTKKTVLAGQGGRSGAGGAIGPYGLPGLTERMLSQDQVSMGQFQRYSAIFADPMIMDALQREIPKINATAKNSIDRFKALQKFYDDVLPPEMIEKYRRSIAGLQEAFNTAILGPETGLFGIGRKMQGLGRKINDFGQYVDDLGNVVTDINKAAPADLSVFDMLRDVFANTAQVLMPIIENISLIYDPLRMIGLELKDARHYTAEFLKSFNQYRDGLVEYSKTLSKAAGGKLLETKDLRASFAAISNMFLQIGAIGKTDYDKISKQILDPNANVGAILKGLIDTFLKGDAAFKIGEFIGNLVGTVLSEVAKAMGFVTGMATGGPLAKGLMEGFKKAGGADAFSSIIRNTFALLGKLLLDIVKAAPMETLFMAGLLTLPAVISGLISAAITSVLSKGLPGLGQALGRMVQNLMGVKQVSVQDLGKTTPITDPRRMLPAGKPDPRAAKVPKGFSAFGGKLKGFIAQLTSYLDDALTILPNLGGKLKSFVSLLTTYFDDALVAIRNLPSALPSLGGKLKGFLSLLATYIDDALVAIRNLPSALPSLGGKLKGFLSLLATYIDDAIVAISKLPSKAAAFAKAPKALPTSAITPAVTKGMTSFGNFFKTFGTYIQGVGPRFMGFFKGIAGKLSIFGAVLTSVISLFQGKDLATSLAEGAGPLLGAALGAALIPFLGPIGPMVGAAIGGFVGSLDSVTVPLTEVFRSVGGALQGFGDSIAMLVTVTGDLFGEIGQLIGGIFGVKGEFDGLKIALAPFTLAIQALELGLKGFALLLAEMRVFFKRYFGSSEEYQDAIKERDRLNASMKESQGRINAYNASMLGTENLQKQVNDAQYELINGGKKLNEARKKELVAFIKAAKELDKKITAKVADPAKTKVADPDKTKVVQEEKTQAPTSPKMPSPSLWDNYSNWWTTNANKFMEGVKKLPDNLSWIAGYMWQKTTEVWQGIQRAFVQLGSWLSSLPGKLQGAVSRAVSALESGWNRFTSWLANLPSRFLSQVSSTTAALNSGTGQIVSAIVNWAKSLPGRIASGFMAGQQAPQPSATGVGYLTAGGKRYWKGTDGSLTALSEAFGSANPYSGSLGQALAFEQKNKPAGSGLVVANSSETVIPAAGGHGMEAFIGTMGAGFNSIVQTYLQVQQKQEGVLSSGFSRVQQSYMSSAQQQQNALNKINSTLVSNQQQTNSRLSTLETKFSSPAMPGGLGGGAAGGVDAFTPMAQQMGLTMTSGYRPGDPGWHGANRARDFSNGTGPTPQMMQFAQMLASRYGSNLKELIYTPLGFSIKNGQRVAPYAQGAHYNHVHVAYANGIGQGMAFNSLKGAQAWESSMVSGSVKVGSVTANSGEGFGGSPININAPITINQQPGQSADELASIVAMKIGEAVADARAASIFV